MKLQKVLLKIVLVFVFMTNVCESFGATTKKKLPYHAYFVPYASNYDATGYTAAYVAGTFPLSPYINQGMYGDYIGKCFDHNAEAFGWGDRIGSNLSVEEMLRACVVKRMTIGPNSGYYNSAIDENGNIVKFRFTKSVTGDFLCMPGQNGEFVPFVKLLCDGEKGCCGNFLWAIAKTTPARIPPTAPQPEIVYVPAPVQQVVCAPQEQLAPRTIYVQSNSMSYPSYQCAVPQQNYCVQQYPQQFGFGGGVSVNAFNGNTFVSGRGGRRVSEPVQQTNPGWSSRGGTSVNWTPLPPRPNLTPGGGNAYGGGGINIGGGNGSGNTGNLTPGGGNAFQIK